MKEEKNNIYDESTWTDRFEYTVEHVENELTELYLSKRREWSGSKNPRLTKADKTNIRRVAAILVKRGVKPRFVIAKMDKKNTFTTKMLSIAATIDISSDWKEEVAKAREHIRLMRQYMAGLLSRRVQTISEIMGNPPDYLIPLFLYSVALELGDEDYQAKYHDLALDYVSKFPEYFEALDKKLPPEFDVLKRD